jgi:hypothetical protein
MVIFFQLIYLNHYILISILIQVQQTGIDITPVMKISTDNGKTFGPMLKLAANGTIGSSSGG